MNTSDKNSTPVYWMSTIYIETKKNIKELLINFFKKKGVMLRPFFYPISSMPMYKKKLNNKNSYKISKSAVNLPSGYNLTTKDINYISNQIKFFLKNKIK